MHSTATPPPPPIISTTADALSTSDIVTGIVLALLLALLSLFLQMQSPSSFRDWENNNNNNNDPVLEDQQNFYLNANNTTSTTTSTTTAAASTTTSTATTAPSFLRILEDCRMIKTTSNPTENYGRMLPWAVHKIMQTYNNNNNNNDDDDDDDDNDIMSLIRPQQQRPQQQRPQQQPPPPPPPPPVRLFNSSSILVDIGHGIGNSCFQAAYMFGCTTRGIECHKPRHTVAQVLQLQLQEAVRVHQQRDHMVSNVQKKKNKKKCSSCFCLFVETHVR